MPDFLNYEQVGQKLGVSAALVRKLAREGKLVKRHVGRRVVFDQVQVDSFMRQIVKGDTPKLAPLAKEAA